MSSAAPQPPWRASFNRPRSTPRRPLSASSEPNWTSSPRSFWAERVFRAAGESVLQTVVGVLFLGVISSGLNILNVPVDAQLFAKGVIIDAALSLSARAVASE